MRLIIGGFAMMYLQFLLGCQQHKDKKKNEAIYWKAIPNVQDTANSFQHDYLFRNTRPLVIDTSSKYIFYLIQHS